MSDLDQMLYALRVTPSDDRLGDIGDAIMARMGRRRERAAARRSMALAGIVAIGVGWSATLLPAETAKASPMAIGMSDYAPSRLLGQ